MRNNLAPGGLALELLLIAAITIGVQSAAEPAASFSNVSEDYLPQPALVVQSKDARPIDIDGDGDLDIAIAHEYKPNVLLVNDGEGRFSNESIFRLPQQNRDSEDIAAADFDGDGDTDLLFVSEDDEENELYLNDGTGVFSDAGAMLPTAGVSNGVASADINNDDVPDLVIGNSGLNILLVGNDVGGFRDETAARLPALTDMTQDLEFGDVDGDGDLDLLVGNEDHNRLLINDGEGVFADESAARLPVRGTPEETREADFGDVDGDGDLDIFFANVNFNRIGDPSDRLLINDGNGFFSDESELRLPPNQDYTMDADFIDLDDDGDLDIVTAGLVIDKGLAPIPYRVFANDSSGNFIEATGDYFTDDIVGVGTDIEAADFNGDGRLDLFLANRAGPDILLFGQ